MIDDNNFVKMASEVLEMLKHLQKEQVDKIPKQFLEKLNELKDPSLNIVIDDSKELFEQNVCYETKLMMYLIFRDYLSSPEERQKINDILKNLDDKYDENYTLEKIFNINT